MAVLPTDQARSLVSMLEEITVAYVKVLSSPTIGRFSDLHTTLDVRSEASIPLLDLWCLDENMLKGTSETDPKVCAAVNRLVRLIQDTDTPKMLSKKLWNLAVESKQFLEIIVKVLLPLTGQDSMDVNIREYPESLVSDKPVRRSHLGIGSPLTWHGAPDGRCEIDLVNVDVVDQDDDSSGTKTPIEMKHAVFNRASINQLLGNVVVYSFVQNRRHPSLNPFVPAVGLSGNQGSLVLSLYDCSSDIMLHSRPIMWLDFRAGQFKLEGILLLWLALHHRLFLKRVTGDEPCSGLHERLRRDGALAHFQALYSMSVKHWLNTTCSYSPPMLKKKRLV